MEDPGAPKQLPLELALRPAMSRDDLIVARSNQPAVELVDQWPGWLAAVAVLAGPSGSGKTHLAAIWAEKSGAICLDPQALGNLSLLNAAPRPVLIEDIDAAPFNETGLFHLINSLRQSGNTLLITARRPPQYWQLALPDLISRLTSAALVNIEAPDDALLSAVLAKLFSDRQVSVDASVISFLVNRMERSLAAAADIAGRLDRLALERQVRISRSLAAQIVSDRDPRQEEMEL